MRTVAIIEPDHNRSECLQAAVEQGGFRAVCFTSSTEALPQLRARTYALALLALDPREEDPFAICSEVSRHLPTITIARDAASDTCIRALECGADDCIARAISGRELVARIQSILRRRLHPEDRQLESLTISLAEMRIRTGEATQNLTHGETEVLAVLLEHAPAPVPVLRLAQLLDARRGTIESRLKSLRRKLGPGRLVSRGGLGYQLIADEPAVH